MLSARFEAKRFCLVFPEGKGLLRSWATLAEKLRSLGVVTFVEAKNALVPVVGRVERSLGSMGKSEKRAFVDVARAPTGRIGDALWLQLGGRKKWSREEQLGRCLVGRWGISLRRWGERLWNLKRGVRFSKLGGAFFLLEFEDGEEAKRVLKGV